MLSLALGIGSGLLARVLERDLSRDRADRLSPFHAIALVVFLVGITVFINAVRRGRSSGRRRCPNCSYDMSGSGLLCPECGHTAPSAKELYRPRRRKRGIAIAAALIAASYGVWVYPRIRTGGPIGAVPTWVLIAGMSWLPDSMISEDPNHSMDNDWSLRRRFVDSRLSTWERHLVHWRARRLILSECSVAHLDRAMNFVEETDTDLVAPRDVIIARGIANPDPAARSDAAFTTIGPLFDAWSGPLGERVRPLKAGLVAALSDPVPQVRGLAAWYLTELGAESDAYVPKMLSNLAIRPTGLSFHLRDITDDAIERRARESDEALSLVLAASRSDNDYLNFRCMMIVSSRELFPRGGRDRLFEVLRGPDADLAAEAAALLCRASDPEALPEVVAFVETHRSYGGVIEALGHYEDRVVPFLPRLLPLAQQDDEDKSGVLDLLRQATISYSIDPAVIDPFRFILEGVASDAPGSYDSDLAKDLLIRVFQPVSPAD